MKKMLGGQKFASDTEVQSVVRQWPGQQSASFFASGIQELVAILDTSWEHRIYVSQSNMDTSTVQDTEEHLADAEQTTAGSGLVSQKWKVSGLQNTEWYGELCCNICSNEIRLRRHTGYVNEIAV